MAKFRLALYVVMLWEDFAVTPLKEDVSAEASLEHDSPSIISGVRNFRRAVEAESEQGMPRGDTTLVFRDGSSVRAIVRKVEFLQRQSLSLSIQISLMEDQLNIQIIS